MPTARPSCGCRACGEAARAERRRRAAALIAQQRAPAHCEMRAESCVALLREARRSLTSRIIRVNWWKDEADQSTGRHDSERLARELSQRVHSDQTCDRDLCHRACPNTATCESRQQASACIRGEVRQLLALAASALPSLSAPSGGGRGHGTDAAIGRQVSSATIVCADSMLWRGRRAAWRAAVHKRAS